MLTRRTVTRYKTTLVTLLKLGFVAVLVQMLSLLYSNAMLQSGPADSKAHRKLIQARWEQDSLDESQHAAPPQVPLADSHTLPNGDDRNHVPADAGRPPDPVVRGLQRQDAGAFKPALDSDRRTPALDGAQPQYEPQHDAAPAAPEYKRQQGAVKPALDSVPTVLHGAPLKYEQQHNAAAALGYKREQGAFNPTLDSRKTPALHRVQLQHEPRQNAAAAALGQGAVNPALDSVGTPALHRTQLQHEQQHDAAAAAAALDYKQREQGAASPSLNLGRTPALHRTQLQREPQHDAATISALDYARQQRVEAALANKRRREEGEKRREFERVLTASQESVLLSEGCAPRPLGGAPALAFVKVHKSASSTVANVMARYALRHVLNVALPNKLPGTKKFNYFDPEIKRQDLLPVPPGQAYEVIFNHMIFQRRDLDKFMPTGNKTFYFAIARHPEDRLISSFVYYQFAAWLMKQLPVATVKEALLFLVQNSARLSSKLQIPELHNSFASDTGLAVGRQRDLLAIGSHAQRLDRHLDLVMLVEAFDESLVLLKRKACLSMLDIVYLVKNARPSSRLASVRLSPAERKQVWDFQMADFLLYEHCSKRFWRQVHAQGPDFFLEVQHFKGIQRQVCDFCAGVSSQWDSLSVARSQWNEAFLVTVRECRLMAMTELSMQTYLQERAVRLYRMDGG